jgi:hypothetical protein
MATASQTTSSVTAPSPAWLQSCTATTPRMPFTPAMAVPVLTGMPIARASCGSGPDRLGPRIDDAGHVEPACFSAMAVR